jgi:hypothetical protein
VLARRPRGAFISAIERASASLAYRSLVAHAARRRSRSALSKSGRELRRCGRRGIGSVLLRRARDVRCPTSQRGSLARTRVAQRRNGRGGEPASRRTREPRSSAQGLLGCGRLSTRVVRHGRDVQSRRRTPCRPHLRWIPSAVAARRRLFPDTSRVDRRAARAAATQPTHRAPRRSIAVMRSCRDGVPGARARADRRALARRSANPGGARSDGG